MKKFLFSFCIIFLCAIAFSQNTKVRVIVANAKCINIDEETKSYLPFIVQQKFESNIGQYMHFLIVDTSNLNEVKRLQQNSEGDSYDEATAIKIGKLANANYAFFPKITKVGKKYFLSVGCTDLTTGLQSANSMSKSFQEVDKLFDGAGSAADAVTLDLCGQLGLVLTSGQISTLQAKATPATKAAPIAQEPKQDDPATHLAERQLFIKAMKSNCTKVYEKESDFRYTLNDTYDGITITGIKEDTSQVKGYGVIIPDEIDGVKVTGVTGNKECYMFHNYNPNSKIDWNDPSVKEQEANLKKKNNLFYMDTVKYILFSDNITTLDMGTMAGCEALEMVMLPNNITIINEGLFLSCPNLKSIKLPKNVKKILNSAFDKCKKLEKVICNDTLQSIDSYAFVCCSGLRQITLPQSLKEIKEAAFWKCTALYTITLPDNITILEESTFQDCYALEEVTLGKSIKQLNKDAFKNCENLKDVFFLYKGDIYCHNTTFDGCKNLSYGTKKAFGLK